jgi:NADPH-dependent 2,4-dienoyl-CoA reductase/sulfur reductase-like enzyme
MAVAKAAHIEPLHQVSLAITKAALVVGGGVAGMEAALGVADQGADVVLVEKSTELGGVANLLNATWQGEPIAPYLADTINRVKTHPGIRLFTGTRVKSTTGSIGNFSTTLVSVNGGQTKRSLTMGPPSWPPAAVSTNRISICTGPTPMCSPTWIWTRPSPPGQTAAPGQKRCLYSVRGVPR